MDILGNHIEGIESTYSELLESISDICRQFEEKHDYSQDILEMAHAETINDLIKTYNNIIKLIAIGYYGKRVVPRDWYVYQSWGSEHNKYIKEISDCLNDCIFEWYKRQDNTTSEALKTAVVNLRNSNNQIVIQDKLLAYAGASKNEEIGLLIRERDKHWRWRIQMYSFPDIQGYLNEYIFLSKVLSANGHVFDLVEVSFGKEKNIDYEVLAAEYKKELEEEAARRKEAMKRRVVIGEHNPVFDSDNPFNQMGNLFLEGVFSFLLTLPFAFFGGIFGNMNKRR